MTKSRIIRSSPMSFIKELVLHGFESFGRYYSTYRGYVSDREDSENLGRLKLIIPSVTGQNIYNYWAFPRNQFSGEGYGIQCLPQKGDLVWVEFEGGRPEVPIWSYGHFGRKEFPTEKELKDKNTYWFKSPAGNLVIINDTKKSITIKNPAGAEVVLNDTGLISVKNKNTDLKKLLSDVLMMYLKTTTISGSPLSPTSIKSAVDNLVTLNKLLS